MTSTFNVFGLHNEILDATYIDRGGLDKTIDTLSKSGKVIAIRGASKSGKSWLRQKSFSNALVVQCRYGHQISDILTEALSQLGIQLILERSSTTKLSGSIQASSGTGLSLLFKAEGKGEASREQIEKFREYGNDINDLRFIAKIINESNRKLVIEDFHYLEIEIQKQLSFDLKTLWDYGCFAVVVGVWGKHNLLTTYNSDLSLRCTEIQIAWSDDELKEVVSKGCRALNVSLPASVINGIVQNSFGNSGLLQTLALHTLLAAGITEKQSAPVFIPDENLGKIACQEVAAQLDATYLTFAERVASGIRKRKRATGIYAHAMASIVSASDKDLIDGLSADAIYDECHGREPRIQKANLKSILAKIDGLQIDNSGRGLVVTYNIFDEKIINIDRQLLFYRTHCTARWPWHEIIKESETTNNEDYGRQLTFDDLEPVN